MLVLNLILSLFLSWFNPTEEPTQPTKVNACNAKVFKDKCIKDLPDGYTFLKSYTIDGQGGVKKKVEFSYIFSKNNNYLVMLANSNPQTKGIVVTLYDSNRKKLASSFSKEKYYPAMAYKCNATGIYYLSFTFENTNDFCAGSVLSFKR
jgi:hypothetical protein